MKLPLPIGRRVTRSGINTIFTAYCFLLPPILGSAVSVAYNSGGVWAVAEVAASRRRFHLPRPVILQTVALYAYCASYFLSSAVNASFEADASKLLSLATFLFFPFTYMTWSISQKSRLAEIVILASMGACFGGAMLAVPQYYWLGIRAEGGAGNAIVFATVICLAVMMCLAGRLSGLAGRKAPLMPAAIAGTVAILLSGTRVIWFAAPLAAGLLLLIYRKSFSSVLALRLLFAAAIVLAVLWIFGSHLVMARIEAAINDIARMTAAGNYDTPVGLRIALWEIGLEAFRQSPVFGHGAGATQALIRNGMHDDFGLDRGFSHFHNGFLTALVEGGLLCMASLASIFAVATVNAVTTLLRRSDALERLGAAMIVVVVVTYLTAGLTGILVGHDILDSVLMIFLAVGTYLACGRKAGSTADGPAPEAEPQ